MPVVTRSALVTHSAPSMYQLINDVESYPEFLPWCRSTKLHYADDEAMEATIEVARSGVRQSFTTRNRLQRDKRIDIELVKGPFKRLRGVWTLLALRDDACKITLEMDFEFSGRLMNAAFGAVFNHIASTLVDSFRKRADEVYGGR